ncbi:MAG: CHASE2 domain-containing protein [Chitinophagaceae bacterium]|nr:CHASE2 domain-containing protein [Chitinophagaceae bacterium]MBL0273418.1 CHASE2 domain-containing protein [Chitinophagaceae bacterium]
MKKPLHKHIGHQARKVHGRVTKYLLERDTMFATVWVFLFIIILGAIPLNLGVINPIKLGLKDFDSNDLSYSKLGKAEHTDIDTNIVIINIGHADREGIAYIIEKTATLEPKVMALDVVFDEARDPSKDSLLRETFKKNKNLVVAVKYQLDSSEKMIVTRNYFKDDAHQYGYVNFPNEDKETTRYFFPLKKTHDTSFTFFSSAILKFYDTVAYKKLIKKGDSKVMINYSRHTNQYLVINADDLLMNNVDSSAIKGKIALLAYVNTNPDDIEDKKFTPMNEKYAGKSHPDMNGIVIHANIISMALENNYIKKLPLWGNMLIAIFVCWLHMSFFVHYYLESHIWFHLVAKIAQVASAIFFMWLGIYLFDKYRLKVDMKMSLVVIVLAVDVIYFYEAWAVWMHKKFNFTTVFKPHHH